MSAKIVSWQQFHSTDAVVHKLIASKQELEAANRKLMEQLERALEALEGMVEQDCTLREGRLHHGFRRANEEAFSVLEEEGRLRRVEGTRESYRFTTEEERRGR